MKKLNKLFAMFFAVLGVGTLSAQTDVTSTYLTNAGFETDGHQTGTKVPTGWTLEEATGGYTSYRPISDTTTPNGNLPISDGVTAGASEGSCYLYMRTNWGASACELTQTTQALPAGKYKLMVDVALPQTEVSRLRTLTIKVKGSTSGTTNSVECCYNPAIWTTVSVPFETTSEESVVISLYHNDTSGGCSAGVLTAIDNVRLYSYDYAAMTSALTEAESLYDSSKEGATELNTAMTTAKSLTESSDKSSIASAAETLIDALNTYKQAQFVAPSSTDYTSWIANAQLETTTGGTVFSSKANMWNSNVPSSWYVTRAVNGSMNATTYGTGQSGKAFEIWATDASTVIGTFFQPVNELPAGKYTLKGYLQNSGKLFVANGTETTDYSASPTTTGVWEQFSITFVKKSASDNLIIGAQTTAAQHFIVDDFSLECVGLDLLQLTSQRDGLVNDLEALQSKLPTTYYSNTVATAIATAKEADSESTLTEAINNLSSILTTANSMSSEYTKLTDLIALCTDYTKPQNSNANSDDVLTTFQTAITTATTDGNAATTVDAINTVYSTLETARQTYARNAVPVYPYPFDMTFMLPNTTFDSNIDGWTKTGGANWMSAGKNVECYNNTFDFYTEYTGLNNGSWEIQVDAFYRYGGYNAAEAAYTGGTEQLLAILYANNSTVAVKSIMEGANKAGSVGAITTNGVRVPNAPADCDAYFATGCYTNSIATVIADGNLKVGIKKETTQSADWTIFDNFKLIYKGIDVTDLQTALSDLITKAEAIKESKMGAAESTALTNALSAADATVTDADELSTMITDLNNAYDAAVPSIDTYSKVPAYIAKANKVDTSIAASYQTAYDNGTIEGDAETVRQELNVATFNFASEIFSNNFEVTGWTGTMGGMNTSGQHWDGTTETKYYDNNSWNGTAHSTTASVTLPQGTYVLKAALRSHAATTLKLTVLDNVVDVEGKGDTGYGIAVGGTATFSKDSTYANENKGRGWEWEFVKFTLTEKTTVDLKVECNYNGVYGWASFSDITLWMDDATYVVANAGAITAPLAEAKALVGTKPMGMEEDAALTDAIAQAEGTLSTPAQLNAAVDALKTAVTNANNWVTAYNEAKAPLVAALERFEADYNLEGDVDHAHMAQSRWATVIEKAQAAAEAKDVTNSYEGFATATDNLVAALDAADTSIAEYADLKEAIASATEELSASVNWGDQPFQRPESAKETININIANAQAVYDAAEADGEGVTAVITSLDNGINNVVLNAPAEGDMFNITVATEGHGLQGNPVVASLGGTGDNNPTGYNFNASVDNTYNPFTKAYTFEQVEGNKYRISVKVNAETVYLTYGSLNGSAAGWATQQIQGTKDKESAGTFLIEASTTQEGVVKIFNTVHNEYLDCQDHGPIYTDTGIANEDFALTLIDELRASVDINISADNQLSTCVLMFETTLPEGLDAYVYESYDPESNHLILNVIENRVLPAYTPCLLYAENGIETTLTGTVDAESYTATTVTIDGGYLNGAIDKYTITEGYLLQNQGEGAKFHTVSGIDGGVEVPVGKCWLTIPKTGTASVEGARSISFSFRGGAANNIEELEVETPKPAMEDGAIYTLDGKRVKRMERGQVYIINGQKVMIK